jgi:hypothetical protein
MEHAHWLAVTLTFVCPVCGKPSTQKMAVNSPLDDPSIVATAINLDIDENGITCQVCSRTLYRSAGLNVMVKVLTSTLAELKADGYYRPSIDTDN